MSRYVGLVICSAFFCVNIEYSMQPQQIYRDRIPSGFRYKIFKEYPGCLVDIVSDFPEGNKDYHHVIEFLKNKNFSKKDRLAATILAIAQGRTHLVSALIEKGIDVHAKSNYIWLEKNLSDTKCTESHVQWPPLCFAVFDKKNKLIRLLFQKGARFKDLEKGKSFMPWLVKRYGQKKAEKRLSTIKQMETLEKEYKKQKDKPTETKSLVVTLQCQDNFPLKS